MHWRIRPWLRRDHPLLASASIPIISVPAMSVDRSGQLSQCFCATITLCHVPIAALTSSRKRKESGRNAVLLITRLECSPYHAMDIYIAHA